MSLCLKFEYITFYIFSLSITLNIPFIYMYIGDVPLGRGSVRGRRTIDIEHFRSPRPQSSLGTTGKQGKHYLLKNIFKILVLVIQFIIYKISF